MHSVLQLAPQKVFFSDICFSPAVVTISWAACSENQTPNCRLIAATKSFILISSFTLHIPLYCISSLSYTVMHNVCRTIRYRKSLENICLQIRTIEQHCANPHGVI